MKGRNCLQDQRNSLHKDITRGLLPFTAGATLIRTQRFFQIGALLNKWRALFLYTPTLTNKNQ